MDPAQENHTPNSSKPTSHLSRRGFLTATTATTIATLASCNPVSGFGDDSEDRNYGPSGVFARNPSNNLPANFPKNAPISYSRVLVSGKHIAITFDDGPHPVNTPRLLDMLAVRNIRATFYVIGRSVLQNPGVLRRTVAAGHEIGNHSQNHPLLTKLGDSQLRSEMLRCEDAIGKTAGVRPRTMRPPYGGLLQRQRELVFREFGYPTILWSVDPLDWKKPGASVITSRIVSATTAGGIVLAHDLHSQTIDAMPATLDGLLRRGFQFVTVSQLIAMQATPVTAPSAQTLPAES